MAVVTAENVAVQARGLGSLPVLRQFGLMIGLAVSVALGVTVALWSQTPSYSLLTGNLSAKDMSEVTKSLDGAGIEYQFEPGSGGILVPAEKLQQARMKIAASGVNHGGDVGFELLDKDQGFGSNSFLLKARYNRALEGELAQSIGKLKIIESARVHLAIPKQSAFARQGNKPAASVVINLYPGRVLNESQTAGIINIVASSVPGLDADQVTVVDDKGRLLSSRGGDSDMQLTSTQFDYTRKLEDRYVKRIIDIIGPIVGSDGVRAQVVADIDFTSLSETKESYLPEQRVVRSEQLFEETTNQASALGVPGALSNQSPADAVADAAQADAGGVKTSNVSGNNSSRAVRNYEIDRTISHTRQSPVKLERLSVAVIVDYRTKISKKGKVKKIPLKKDELQRITNLVKEAVGLNEGRGDTINIVNTSFQVPEAVAPLPDPPVWEQPWLLSAGKQLLGGLFVVFIAFGILRPMLTNLSKQGENVAVNMAAAADQQGAATMGDDRVTLSNQSAGASAGQQLIEMAGSMVKENPKRVAQVLNNWVEQDQ